MTTKRGLENYADFFDAHGLQIRVRQSSSALESKVWIFMGRPDSDDPLGILLTADQADVLRRALVAWREDFVDSA